MSRAGGGTQREGVSYWAGVEASGDGAEVVGGRVGRAAAEHGAGARAIPHGGPRWAVPGAPAGAARLGGQLLGPGAPRAAVEAVGRAGGLQVLQPLGEGQLLLDGHAQQRVEGLLLVLGRRQLPLHLVQLGDVLVTPGRHEGERDGEESHARTHTHTHTQNHIKAGEQRSAHTRAHTTCVRQEPWSRTRR